MSETVATTFTCPNCPKVFKRKGDMKRHIDNFHNPDAVVYACAICDKAFKRKDKLKDHIPSHDPKERGSKGERAIMAVLDELKLSYQFDQVYQPFREILGRQRFDFIVFNEDRTPRFMVEFDGLQHFKPANFGGITNEEALRAYVKTRRHDDMKDTLCRERGYPLLRIPYNQIRSVATHIRAFIADPTFQPPQPTKRELPAV